MVKNTPKGETKEVVLTDNGFEPAQITLKKGDSIRFTTTRNESFWPASNLHPLHSLYAQFDPKEPIKPGQSWTFRFKKEGEWGYHDHLFPYFKGTIVVGEDFHLQAHKNGEKLYADKGLVGIGDCDSGNAFGCFHGFLLRAVGEGGVEAAVKADKVCVERFGILGLGCSHGIGHGLGEYFGQNRLEEQLEVCGRLTWQGELFGCQQGVFMEYNFPWQKPRQLTSNLYSPCDEVEERFAGACYFELPAWWRVVLENDFTKMGSLCGGIAGESEREDCYLGLGSNAAETGSYTMDGAIRACGQMPDLTSKTLCFAGASWAFFADPNHREESQAVCGLSNINQSLCLQKAKLL